MAYLNEQNVVNGFYPNDNTKIISDVIELLRQNTNYSTEEIQNQFKNSLPYRTDWSF